MKSFKSEIGFKDSLSDIKTDERLDKKSHKILDFEPMFLEIKIISETFFLLQEVINYKSTALDPNSGVAESIVHFAKARQTFKMLQNSFG